MQNGLNELLTVTFTLFAVIDVLGSIPLLLSLKKKMGGIPELKATLISGGLMILFLFIGEPLLHLLGVETHSFAVAGSIVIFFLGMEMILGIELFKSEKGAKNTVMVPIAFPLIAGSGTLTTIISLKANYTQITILTAILVNLPGEASSVVTTLDGYQMARQGLAGPALSTAALGSFCAGSVGVLILAAFATPLTKVAFKFGPAEYFSLLVLGLIAAVVLA
ncbi:MAG: MarC family protein, partial [Bacteroidota bacterium]|nr:MarC family protein [Bacteroidota bacterium]